jgi:hypothetical protein
MYIPKCRSVIVAVLLLVRKAGLSSLEQGFGRRERP